VWQYCVRRRKVNWIPRQQCCATPARPRYPPPQNRAQDSQGPDTVSGGGNRGLISQLLGVIMIAYQPPWVSKRPVPNERRDHRKRKQPAQCPPPHRRPPRLRRRGARALSRLLPACWGWGGEFPDSRIRSGCPDWGCRIVKGGSLDTLTQTALLAGLHGAGV
jgi:hypothetical protein